MEQDGIMIMYRDKFGKQLNTMEWCKLFENMEYRRIGSRYLWGGIWVSTVWLGLDHGFGGQELYFETMVFKNRLFKRGREDIDQIRYTNLHQAEQGHEATVDKYMPWFQKLFLKL